MSRARPLLVTVGSHSSVDLGLAVTAFAFLVSCAGVHNQGGGGGNGGGGGGNGVDAHPLSDAILQTCGNSRIDPTELCDDGNTNANDGCNQLCQIEANWSCPTPGQKCIFIAVCGNGVLTSDEACDDGNTMGGDGCSADCKTVEPGYQCRVPGKKCVPLCGDGVITGSEKCDDHNTDSGDGCSSTCLVEPGASCPPAGGPCVKAVCGDGVLGAGETCDCGTDPSKLPTGCTGPNGLFNGDGTGCSRTCTKEPVCRDASGTTHACATTCGNGNIEAGEACDDGNLAAGDGCSATCTLESGFTCMAAVKPDTQDCLQTDNLGGKCLELPIKYRDFKNETLPGGHPDFFFYGATLATPVTVNNVTVPVAGGSGGGMLAPTYSFTRRYCVPNSSGPAKQNDSTARCWDMAKANLDANGRPTFNPARVGGTNCDCQFTDFSHDTNGGHVPGYTNAVNGPLYLFGYVAGTSGHPVYKGQAPVVTSATTFGQWWNDGAWESDGTTPNKHAVSFLELAPVPGGTNLFRYSSAPHSVYGNFFPLDPPANAFPIYTLTGSMTGPGTIRTTPAPWSEPLLCNLWPYWYSSTQFGAGAGCTGAQYVFPPSFAPGVDPAVWFGMHPNGDWIPAPPALTPPAQGWFHDAWFSVEARDLFVFNGAFDLQFFGDDDTFVFINGVLAIDLGGVHQRLPGKVHVDDLGNATTQEGGSVYLPCTNAVGQTTCPVIPPGFAVGDMVPCTGASAIEPVTKQAFNATCANGTCDCRVRTLPLGLQKGSTYEIAVFSRDGHPTESNFQLTLSGFTTNITQCAPRCGDGVKSGGEECDCGDGTVPTPAGCDMPNNDTEYGGCTSQCKFGPFCGDKIQNGPEACDLGRDNGNTALGPQGCTLGCTKPHYCGDAVPDPGEQCDLGTGVNGAPGQLCSTSCTVIIP